MDFDTLTKLVSMFLAILTYLRANYPNRKRKRKKRKKIETSFHKGQNLTFCPFIIPFAKIANTLLWC